MNETKIKFKVPYYVGWNQGPRDYQEDYYSVIVLKNRILMVIADGMGGHTRGDLASKWLVDSMINSFNSKQNVAEIFKNGIESAKYKIDQSGKDMGCTMVAVIIEKEEDLLKMSYTWLGDSRLYIYSNNLQPTDNAKKISRNKDNNLWLLTDDDSFVWGFYLNNELSLDDITQHPSKNQLEVTLHSKQKNVVDIAVKRISSVHLHGNDKLLLCSDGVWETYQAQVNLINHMNNINPRRMIQEHLIKAEKDKVFNDNGTYIIADLCNDLFKQRSSYPIKNFSIKKNYFYILMVFIFIGLLLFALSYKFGILSNKKTIQESLSNKNKQTEIGKKSIKKEKLSYYSIQVGVYKEYDNVRKVSKLYQKMNYSVKVIESVDGSKGILYSVLIGKYKDKVDAQKELIKLNKNFIIKKKSYEVEKK